ncbi:MAG: hypothetical protein JXX14_08345 [Deltaproteobacteria bacterium]|nr:hypothetical protein [Deltaproteobacteria bacterium]
MSGAQIDDQVIHQSLCPRCFVMLPALALDGLIVAICWNNPVQRWLAIGVCFFFGGVNALLIQRLSARFGHMNVSRFRIWFNSTGQVLKAIVSHAAIPVWGLAISFAAMTDRKGVVFSRPAVFSLVGALAVVSVYYHVDPKAILAFSGVTIMTMSVSMSRSSVLYEAALEKRRQREQLTQLQKVATYQDKMSSLGLLAAGIAHEINNPMTFVTTNIQHLEKDFQSLCSDVELRQEYVHDIVPDIREGITRVNTIVDDLRRFARGDVETRSTYDVNEIIRSSVRMTHGRKTPGIRVSLALDDIPLQLGYPRQLSQVVVNLLVNALQAVNGGGHISIRSGCDDRRFRFSVTDDGPGIDRRIQHRIFEPFFTTKPVGEGTGLGLAVVHGIVLQLNGHIALESDCNKGTTFTVTLPLQNNGDDTGTVLLETAESAETPSDGGA